MKEVNAGPMIYTLKNAVNGIEVRERIERLRSQFREDISKIEYRFGPDWTGDQSVFLTVHLTPRGKQNFTDLARRFPTELVMQVGSEELGFRSYFDFVNS